MVLPPFYALFTLYSFIFVCTLLTVFWDYKFRLIFIKFWKMDNLFWFWWLIEHFYVLLVFEIDIFDDIIWYLFSNDTKVAMLWLLCWAKFTVIVLALQSWRDLCMHCSRSMGEFWTSLLWRRLSLGARHGLFLVKLRLPVMQFGRCKISLFMINLWWVLLWYLKF